MCDEDIGVENGIITPAARISRWTHLTPDEFAWRFRQQGGGKDAGCCPLGKSLQRFPPPYDDYESRMIDWTQNGVRSGLDRLKRRLR